MDLDIVTKLTSLAFNLDAVVQVLLESSTIKDTVSRWTRVVDDKFVLCSSSFSGGGLGLEKHRHKENKEKPSVSLLRRGLSKAVLGTNHLDV